MAKTKKALRSAVKTSRLVRSARKRVGSRVDKKLTQDEAGGPVRVFRGLGVLYTLAKAAKKGGRRVVSQDLSPLRDAAIVEKGGRIVWVGPEKEIPRQWTRSNRKTQVDELDLGGRAVIPALIESHTHLIYSGNRAAEFERRNQGESYQSIAKSGGGILSTVRNTRAADEKDLARIGQARVDRFIKQGVTTIEVKSGYALTVEDELKMLRAAGRLKKARILRTFLGAHAVPKEFPSAEAYVDHLIERAYPLIQKENLAERADIFVEDGYFSAQVARRYLEAAREHGLQLAVHADQLTRSGGSELAVELSARSAEHLIRISEADVKKLGASDVTCVLLPSADLYVNCPYPPARQLIENGARIALATDFNPGTAPSQDVALVGVLARIQMKMSLPETIVAYTVGGAHALGLEEDLGSLEPGKFCDFCVLDGELEELFLEVGRMPIASVYREGKRLA